MKKSFFLSLGLLTVVGLWMLSGTFANISEPESKEIQSKTAQKMKVRVLDVQAQEITREIVVQGELEPLRQVEIKAETASNVVQLPVAKGEKVKADEVLVQLAQRDRGVQVKRAEAEVSHQRHEVEGARKLKKQGLQAVNRLKQAEAALALAEADLKRARLELSYTTIAAPFSGVLEQRYVEQGSHVETGDPVALLVDASVLKAVGQVAQQSANKLALGQAIKVRLLDGREAEGVVTYISKLGDSETHSFRVEAEVSNAEDLLDAGVSAELRIAIGDEMAHFLSPAVLALDDTGTVGVKTVDVQNQVAFYPIKLVRTEANGVWVSGLPEKAQVISQGQGFVTVGEAVEPVAGLKE
ncbi:MAG: efflux RND transporter periplasmic adaptor subunit [Chromatiales bacterium]|nr:efflux RND transporter periplasmic adaptor subunit [Chromatiales bacterium]